MGIGYNHAARLIDLLEDRGVIGPSKGAGPRDILIDLDSPMPAANEAPQNAAGDNGADDGGDGATPEGAAQEEFNLDESN